MFNGFFGTGSSGSSTPKQISMLKGAPLPSKLTTATSPIDDDDSSPPPPATLSVTSYDAQWEHVKKGPSPSSDTDSDVTTFEELSCSSDDGGDRPDQSPLTTPAPELAKWQEERDWLCQQLDAALAAHRKAESERDLWEHKTVELRTSLCSEQDKEKENRDRKEVLQAENEKLRTTLEQRTQELDAALVAQRKAESDRDRWERKALDLRASRSEQDKEMDKMDVLKADNEKLKATLLRQIQQLDAAREETKQEVETVKTSLQKYMEQVEYLTVDRDRIRKERDSIKRNLSAEIEQLKATHANEEEGFKAAVEEVKLDQLKAHSELGKARGELDAYAHKLDDSLREIADLRYELSMHQQQTRQLYAAREETKRERTQRQSETQKLEGELSAARRSHKEERRSHKEGVEALKTSLQEHIKQINHLTSDHDRVQKLNDANITQLKASLQEHMQRIEYLTADRDRLRKLRDSIKEDLSVEIEQLKTTNAKETERFKAAIAEANLDRAQAHSDLRKARRELDAYAPMLDQSLREVDTLRRELSDAKESSRRAGDLQLRLEIQSKTLQAAREESSELKRELNGLRTQRGEKQRESFFNAQGRAL